MSRFRVSAHAQADFRARAEQAVAFLAGCEGNLDAQLLLNLDEPDLWCIVSTWRNVGSYRRSFNGNTAKMVLVPLLGEAIDEPSAFDLPQDVGENRPRER